MEKHPAIDLNGKDLQLGDWVRVIMVPLLIRNMRVESKDAFSKAVGHTFQIEAFDETGCLELDMWPKICLDSIWLEPFCVKRLRRYKSNSLAFQKKLRDKNAPPPPHYKLQFDIRLKPGVDIETFGHKIISMGSGGGFAVWPDDRRIKGSVDARKTEPDPIGLLEAARQFIVQSELIEFVEIGEISDANGI
jgi:hypothetical protein